MQHMQFIQYMHGFIAYGAFSVWFLLPIRSFGAGLCWCTGSGHFRKSKAFNWCFWGLDFISICVLASYSHYRPPWSLENQWPLINEPNFKISIFCCEGNRVVAILLFCFFLFMKNVFKWTHHYDILINIQNNHRFGKLQWNPNMYFLICSKHFLSRFIPSLKAWYMLSSCQPITFFAHYRSYSSLPESWLVLIGGTEAPDRCVGGTYALASWGVKSPFHNVKCCEQYPLNE